MNCPNWLKNGLIYQVFTGRWEAEIDGNQILKINNIRNLTTRDWEKLIDLGFNVFYFLGIWENNGPILVREENGKELDPEAYPRIPSLFALTDHKKINPVLGEERDSLDLINKIHSLGGKVIVDFIPNHTAQNHKWVKENPDFYVQENGEMVAEFSGDVFKLNYENEDLRQEMVKILEKIEEMGVDGVRCDMAHLVPNYFWEEAIGKIKNKNKDFIFLGEAYPNSLFDYSNINNLYEAGFDGMYNNGLFENLKKVIWENKPNDYLVSYIKSQKQNLSKLAINYWFNHDDPPLDNKEESEEKAQMVQKYLEALVCLTLFLPDIAFVFNGSLLGLNRRLAHHWFEPMDKKYLETENEIDENLKNLFEIRKKVDDFEIEKVWEENNLLCFKNKQFSFFVNFSDKNQEINGEVIEMGKVKIKQN